MLKTLHIYREPYKISRFRPRLAELKNIEIYCPWIKINLFNIKNNKKLEQAYNKGFELGFEIGII